MVFKFGDITFDNLNSPTSFRVRESMNYIPIQRLKGKAVIQELGIPLIEISIEVELKYQFCNVPETIEKLRSVMLKSQEHELVDGAGHSYGTFKLQALDRDIRKTDSLGRVLSATLDLTFLEYAVYDDEVAQADATRAAARQKAFALIEVNPIEVKKKTIYTTPQAISAFKITQATSSAKAASANIKKAAAIPALSTKYIQTAKRQLETAQRAVKEVKTELNNVTSVVSNLAQLKSSVDNVVNTLDILVPSLDGIQASQVPGLVSGSVATLDNQLSNLTSTATIISGITAIRR